jgi:molybdopterin synthase catalytic subunit
MIEITDKPINIIKVIEAASLHEAGAINTFIGTIRNQTSGKTVLRLEFEAYEPMAISEIRKITDQANENWRLLGYAVSHRVGVLYPGDIAVVIAVSTPHRKASFEACQFMIDSLKQTVPIWKREFFEDGDHWVSSHP